MKDEHILPAVFCLLPDHSSETYSVVLNFLKNSISNSPDNFLLDFEVSVFKSIREVYGNVCISGCTFHLFQNLRKQARKKGCGGLFDTNEDAKTLLKMIKSLCFCPPAYIVDIFDSIIDPFITEKGLDESSELCKFMKWMILKKKKLILKKKNFVSQVKYTTKKLLS